MSSQRLDESMDEHPSFSSSSSIPLAPADDEDGTGEKVHEKAKTYPSMQLPKKKVYSDDVPHESTQNVGSLVNMLFGDYGNGDQKRWIILMKSFLIISSTLFSFTIVMMLCGNKDLPLYVVMAILITTVAGYSVKNKFIKHFMILRTSRHSYNSVQSTSFWNIVVIWFTMGILLTASLIWLKSCLIMWDEKSRLMDLQYDLLMHSNNKLGIRSAALLWNVITATLLWWASLYEYSDTIFCRWNQLYDQWIQAPIENEANSSDKNFRGNIPVAGDHDHVLELRNKISDLEKMYRDKTFRRCVGLLVYLFPIDYEFEKKDIIQLWMAEGFIQPCVQTSELLEDAASVYFDVFTASSIFQSSRTGGNIRPRYKLNHSILDDLHKSPSHKYCRIESGKPVSLSGSTLHTSFICDSSTDPVAFETLYQSKRLCTLMLFHEQRYSSINRVPYDLLLELPLLRVLDLSGTNITELPSSVTNLKDLRLLNLSKTLVERLPESLCSLYQMQTLILRDCSKLVGLPKGMRKLVNLRHLDLDIASLLISMPPGIGDMTELQTLPAFIVGKDDGSRITELKHMPNLRGSLAIMMLENISDTVDAKKAALDKKKYLETLELQWSELQDEVDEVLQHLQPHENLKELQIVHYGGTKFPGWIGDPVFSKLAIITLHNCSKCEVLPSLGKLPLLKRLQISEMRAVKTIDARFCGREMVTTLLVLVLKTVHRQATPCKGFPSLNDLRISGMPTLEKWRGMEEGDFSLLSKLSLSRFAKLAALPELSVLKVLQELEISLCPVLQFLPKKGLPTSLQSLLIISCPLLKERCQKGRENWGKIAHIPSIWIDNQQIF